MVSPKVLRRAVENVVSVRTARTMITIWPTMTQAESSSAAQAGAELIRPSEIANPVANRFSARNRNGISLPDMASTRDGVTRGPFVGLGHSAR